MQLTIRNGQKQIKLLKLELNKLTAALEVLSALSACGDDEAGELHQDLQSLIDRCQNSTHQPIKMSFEDKVETT